MTPAQVAERDSMKGWSTEDIMKYRTNQMGNRVTSDWQQQNPGMNFTGAGAVPINSLPPRGGGIKNLLGQQNIFSDLIGGHMTGFGETMGGYGEQLGGFGEKLGGLEEKLGGYGGQFEGVNTKLQELTQGIATLNDKLAGMHQPQQSQQPSYGGSSYGSPFGNPFGSYGGGFNPYGGLGGMFLLGGY